MFQILYLQNSIFGENGQSSQLARRFIDGVMTARPDAELVVRDLVSNGVPHLDLERAGALRGFSETLNDAQKAVLAQSDILIDELKSADMVVIGMPMYNFGVPTQYKAWFDHIARVGETFKYTDNGSVGLLDDKPVYVFAAHGGIHQGQPYETTTTFISHTLAFLGMTSVQFVYAEGLNMGDQAKEQALQKAASDIAGHLETFQRRRTA